ncbi:TRAP-type mannitol/chloroaromatic compound transport system, small permease component [Palleronia salina]|uniref:TRAP transporter small permease protein n=1 Tax=Palleronia salina TaxID=313368 RepID=A0A1M6H7S9_9RHOB|nr:TRAP transporter small permease subunit [Palleronia salina]SHJ18226.1 TRAP-type mannitol/chloroaromatic compound transport system, small permease component [Palleronia salina]
MSDKVSARLASVADIASGIVRIIGQVTAWSGLVLVLLVAFNVLGRYLFNFGTVALQELEWHVLAVAALFGMSYCLNQGGEVRVDIYYGRMSARAQGAVDLFSSIALLVVSLIIAWLSIGFVEQSYSIGEGSADPGGLTHRYILKACIPAAFVLLAVQALAMTCEAAARLLSPEIRS